MIYISLKYNKFNTINKKIIMYIILINGKNIYSYCNCNIITIYK